MSIHFNDGFKHVWNEATIESKLINLATADKGSHWIHPNLDVSESCLPSRVFFWAIGKRFDCTRKLYFINSQAAAAHLSRLGRAIEGHTNLYPLFVKAAANFTEITDHAIHQPQWMFNHPPALMINPPAAPLPAPQLVLVAEPAPATVVQVPVEQVVVHEVHHVPASPVVVVDHGFKYRPVPLPSFTPGYVAPRHLPHVHVTPHARPAPVIAPAHTADGHQIPGTGKRVRVGTYAAPVPAPARPHIPPVAQRAAPPPVQPAQARAAPQPQVRQAPLPARGVAAQPKAERPVANLGARVPVGGRR